MFKSYIYYDDCDSFDYEHSFHVTTNYINYYSAVRYTPVDGDNIIINNKWTERGLKFFISITCSIMINREFSSINMHVIEHSCIINNEYLDIQNTCIGVEASWYKYILVRNNFIISHH